MKKVNENFNFRKGDNLDRQHFMQTIMDFVDLDISKVNKKYNQKYTDYLNR